MEHYKNLSLKDIPGEIWKDIEGFEGYYQVSNMGRVKSLEREVWNGRGYYTKREKILSQSVDNKKHARLCLWSGMGKKTYRTKNLVANAFLYEKKGNNTYVTVKSKNVVDSSVNNIEWNNSEMCSDIVSKRQRDKGIKSSIYKGVRKCYEFRIRINGKHIAGIFGSELEAAKKYDYYVKKYKLNRELNFPDEPL
jgi:hypothetical protein